MGEGGGGSRISQIISRDVDGLDGGDGSLLGGGDTLLHTTHVDGKGGLVTDGRGDTSQKGRHLGTGLGESENVVNEEQHILTLFVTEIFGHSKAGQGDTGTGTWGLVHLTEDKGDLGLAIKLNDGCLLHLVVQIVTLTGSLTDTGEDGVTTVSLSDVVDELLNEHGLADTGTTEETNLSTTGVRGEEIDDFDTGGQNLGRGRLLDERGSLGVDRQVLGGLDGATLVNGVTSDVHDAAQSRRTDGDGDGSTSVKGLSTSDETLRTVHGNAADDVFTQMLGDLEDQLLAIVLGLQGVQNGRELSAIELDIDDGTDDLVNFAGTDAGSGRPSAADGKSERGRSDGTGGGRERRASRAGEGGNAALEHLDR
jgi:peptide chain release factor 1